MDNAELKKELLVSFIQNKFNPYIAYWDIVYAYKPKEQQRLYDIDQAMRKSGEYDKFQEVIQEAVLKHSKL